MGATLWHGSITARRYTIGCPACGHDGATTDCDSIGRTMVSCACTPKPFPMPLVKGGKGLPWRVDLSDLAVSIDDPLPRQRPASRLYSGRPRRGKPCPVDGCHRVCGPKSKFCPRCTREINSHLYPCPEPGCKGLRKHRSPRCRACQASQRHREFKAYVALRVDKGPAIAASRAAS